MATRSAVLAAALYVNLATSRAYGVDLQPAASKVTADSATILQHGRVGYLFADVQDGSILAAKDADMAFVPASNMKLYTTALALVKLGAEYKFRTELRTSAGYQSGQAVIHDLFLIGGGDPNLSGRSLPYLVDSPDGDPFGGLRDLANKLFEAGVREIEGDVTGVATRYGGDLYPDGWTIDDSNYDYGAPVSPLSLNDNLVSVILRPTAAGELAEVELAPSQTSLIVLNQVVTDDSKPTHIDFRRYPGSNELMLSGTIANSTDRWSEEFAVFDPALFAAGALIDVLRERGIMVRGEARSDYRADFASESTLLASRESIPFAEGLQIVNKVSHNLHAEMLLREVAFVRTGQGTLENGRTELEAFLGEIGITRKGTGFTASDGSGLSRSDLTTPNSTVRLLRHMWGRADRNTWLESLPIGGLDGSLEHRFRQVAGSQRLHAKTGSLSHVNALSGYLETKGHRTIAFSIMVNGTLAPESAVRDYIDRLCAVFLE